MQNFKLIGLLCAGNAVLLFVLVVLSKGYGLISPNIWYSVDVLTIIILLYAASHF